MRQSTQKFITRALASLLVVVPFALQQGCGGGGGGGGGSSKPAAPTLAMTVQATKTFHFTWNDVSGETEYRLMEDPDGTSGYTQGPTIAADATQHDLVVSLPLRINAHYILQACNSKGCTDSNEVAVSGHLTEGIGYFKAPRVMDHGNFGSSVALSTDGTVLAVGAGGASPEGASYSGAVYLFRNVGGLWSYEVELKAPNAGTSDGFGTSVALSEDGSVLAVGAANEDGSAQLINGQDDDLAYDCGAVYLFQRNNGTWGQPVYIKGSDTVTNAFFGTSVALSADGTTLAVGASYTNAPTQTGAAYVFRNQAGTWEQLATIRAANADPGDDFGTSVALSADGHLLAVGAPDEGGDSTGINGPYNNSAPYRGAVYLFSDGGSWDQVAYVKPSNTIPTGSFGFSVALSADGNTLAVGGKGGNGIAYLFSASSGVWVEQDYVTASNGEPGDKFGQSVALSPDGSVLAVGAFWEGSSATGLNGDDDNSANGSGAVYLFRKSGSDWTQKSYIKASNTGATDYFGMSVALSEGNTLAVGAREEDGNSIGINGSQDNDLASFSGAVYLY